MTINYPLLIDGGLSNQLERQGYNLNHKLWSAKLLDCYPEAIIHAHLAYLEAGARCITTASYQATISGFMSVGYDRATAEILILKSVELAEKAITRFQEKDFKPLIAASIGPYGAYLADGSEYNGNYGVSKDELRAFHDDRIRLLDSSNADILACETIPSFKEALVLYDLLKDVKKQAWVSFSCRDDKYINDGTQMADCVELFADHPNIFAVGINCTAPGYISKLVKTIKPIMNKKRLIIYPNSGDIYDAKYKTWSTNINTANFLTLAEEWIDIGVDIIGGCCRIGPKEIKSLNKLLYAK
jgi:homocysteine S-methyltransferase